MNIGIAGAGIVGRLLAFELLSLGHKVTLYDKTYARDLNTASFVAAGMLSPYAEMELGNIETVRLGRDAVERWALLCQRLRTVPILHVQGSLLLCKAQQKPELAFFLSRAKEEGLSFDYMSESELNALEPALQERSWLAVHLTQEGWLDPICVMQTLDETLRYRGVIWHERTYISDIYHHNLIVNNQKYSFDVVFDCRGMGALLPALRAVRGEVIHLHAPAVTLTRPIRLLHPRYALYLVPRDNHHYVIGATCIESEDYSPISVQSTLELLSACYAIHPGFLEARIVKTSTQCRPAFSDNVPRVIPTPHCIHINGMYRHGFLLGPKIVSDAIETLNKGYHHAHHTEQCSLYSG